MWAGGPAFWGARAGGGERGDVSVSGSRPGRRPRPRACSVRTPPAAERGRGDCPRSAGMSLSHTRCPVPSEGTPSRAKWLVHTLTPTKRESSPAGNFHVKGLPHPRPLRCVGGRLGRTATPSFRASTAGDGTLGTPGTPPGRAGGLLPRHKAEASQDRRPQRLGSVPCTPG